MAVCNGDFRCEAVLGFIAFRRFPCQVAGKRVGARIDEVIRR